ncbi:MAG TPA: hypothetical protein VHC97_12400 [Thermoanaerobaculia bacterium]|nr:hypothetical protein [Thermoanaerobaculia bacterium]
MTISDSLIRLLGGDPAVFHPLYRVQKLLLKRNVRVVQGRRQGRGFLSGVSPFALLCFYAVIYGIMGTLFFAMARSVFLGGALSLTLGCAFLLLVVITDNFDVLVNPREVLLLAAHPHDDRTFVLAKLAAIGRTLSILALLLFTLPGLMVGFVLRTPLGSILFFLGAAGASVATVMLGLLLAAALLKAGGRKAMERMLPWIQGAFQIGYLFVIGGQRLFERLTLSGPVDLGLWPWLLPSFWFAAPLELMAGPPSAPPFARLGLAAATLGLLLGGAVRWLGPGLTERLLEPVQQRTAAPARRKASRHRKTGGREWSRLFALLRVQLRSDWRTRSEFLLIPLMGAFFLLFYFPDTPASSKGPLMSTFFYGWFLVLSADVLTRSSRPESLWWILASPIDRTRFSLSSLSMVRAFQLAPLFAAAVFAQVRAGAALPVLIATAAELLALGDLLVLIGKGLFPDFPFSRPRAEGGASGERTALTLVGGTVSGLFTGLVYVFSLWGVRGALTGAGVFLLLRFPLSFWTRRRAAAAADRLELGTPAAG